MDKRHNLKQVKIYFNAKIKWISLRKEILDKQLKEKEEALTMTKRKYKKSRSFQMKKQTNKIIHFILDHFFAADGFFLFPKTSHPYFIQ